MNCPTYVLSTGKTWQDWRRPRKAHFVPNWIRNATQRDAHVGVGRAGRCVFAVLLLAQEELASLKPQRQSRRADLWRPFHDDEAGAF